ncbi:MAG TPA: M56 family metallopeptidase, partial [Longimicrobiaceae bacterium]|nr:M56 family metallopeptidase [Longimicrobiaceae bacterium]
MSLPADPIPFLAELTVKATLVLLLTAAAAALLWRSSAAVRHLVSCVGIAGVLALPLFSPLLPAWELPLLPASAAGTPTAPAAPEATLGEIPTRMMPLTAPALEAERTLSAERESPAAGAGPAGLVAALAAAGMLVGLLWLAIGYWGVARLGRRAEVVRDPEWLHTAHEAAERLDLRRPVLLLRSRSAVMPATWGLLWPSVVLPSTADQWPADRRRAVLAHELAHVKRFDCLTQALAQIVCVLLWWHPAVWYAARRLRVERERACDDLVLRAGARASDYAAHLLEIARAHRAMRLAAPALVSMAKPSQLESRLLWILDSARARSAPSVRATLLAVLVGILVVGPLAAMRPIERAASPDAQEIAVVQEGSPEVEHEGVAEAEAGLASGAGDTLPQRISDELLALPGVGGDTLPGSATMTVDELIQMKAVGVTAQYVAEMNAAGFGRLTPEQLISLRAVGVTPAYLAELRRHGYTALSVDEVTSMRAVGVTGEYIEAMNEAGFRELPAEALISLRAVGVTPDYLRELSRHGISGLGPGEVQSLRVVGVTGAYIAQMKALGLYRLDAETLTSLRAVGVTPAYIRELAGVGLTGLSSRALTDL